jgi:short subunit dehydrogenase-like uncharacterized protein
MAENVDKGGVIRRDGRFVPVPAAWKTRAIDFGRGPRDCVTIPWGDVSTAYHSTGIPNIEVYMAAPASMRIGLRLSRSFGWLLRSAPAQRFLKARIRSGPPGPSAERRASARAVLWGEASDGGCGRAAARMTTPEGYTLTVLTSVAIVERVLQGDAPAGFRTPSSAYGPDFVLGVPGVSREDL